MGFSEMFLLFTVIGILQVPYNAAKKSEIQQEIAKEAVLLTQSGSEDLSLQKIVP